MRACYDDVNGRCNEQSASGAPAGGDEDAAQPGDEGFTSGNSDHLFRVFICLPDVWEIHPVKEFRQPGFSAMDLLPNRSRWQA